MIKFSIQIFSNAGQKYDVLIVAADYSGKFKCSNNYALNADITLNAAITHVIMAVTKYIIASSPIVTDLLQFYCNRADYFFAILYLFFLHVPCLPSTFATCFLSVAVLNSESVFKLLA